MTASSARSSPKFYRIHFSPELMAQALWLAPHQVTREFRDGRVISRFSEYWAARLYDFEKSSNANQKGHDGVIRSPLLGELRVCIRSLTSAGIRFQRSGNIGSGRTCTRQALVDALSDIAYVIAVDITQFPVIHTLPTPASRLLALVEAGKLTPSGMSRIRFYDHALGMQDETIPWIEISTQSRSEVSVP